MNVTTYVGGSCAVSAIANIGMFRNPEEVLTAFCRAELGVKHGFIGAYGKLANFYVFSAGPEVKQTEPGGSHHSKDHWPRYGTEFAQYLIDNRLGEVVTLGPKHNFKHHPTTTAQVWVWSPNQEAVEAWWAPRQPKEDELNNFRASNRF